MALKRGMHGPPVSLAAVGLLAAWNLSSMFAITAAILLATTTVAALTRTVREIQ